MNTETRIRSAIALQRAERRARQLADMAVAIASEQARKETDYDPQLKPLQYAHDVAQLAAALLIERIYSEDRELLEIRAERDHYRQQLDQLIRLTPASLTIPVITKPEGDKG